MKLKLIGVETNRHEAEVGTCELCMGIMEVDEPTYIFEKENGETFEIEGWEWSWGDYWDLNIDNVIDFADWVSQHDFEYKPPFGYQWLSNVINQYEEEKK